MGPSIATSKIGFTVDFLEKISNTHCTAKYFDPKRCQTIGDFRLFCAFLTENDPQGIAYHTYRPYPG